MFFYKKLGQIFQKGEAKGFNRSISLSHPKKSVKGSATKNNKSLMSNVAVSNNNINLLLTLLMALILLVTSWSADDAFHGFVMSQNLANGHGFVYNVGERVTASTCPLFSLILAGLFFITRQMVASSVVLCVFLSVASFYIVLTKFADTRWKKIAVFFTCILAQGFFSYANCGLENCLLFFLETIYLYLILSVQTYDFKRLFLIALICSFLLMTRLDVAVLIFIPTAYIFLARHSGTFVKMISAGLVGLLPFFCFSVFCIFYFGFLFPNTYYAKLYSGLPQIEYFERGLEYIWVSALYDFLLMGIIVLAPFFYYKKTKLGLAILAGIVLKILYIIYIGGDFMVCRHFSDVFWYSLCLILWSTKGTETIRLFSKNISFKRVSVLFLIICTILTILFRPFVTLHMWPDKSISNERAIYWQNTSIVVRKIAYFRGKPDPLDSLWKFDRRKVSVIKASPEQYKGALLSWAPGVLVYETNENFYEQDIFALGDPLLARLPASHEPHWRVGHLKHYVPEGYPESLQLGRNEIVDPNLHEYYDIILSITRGELFSLDRIKQVIYFQLGKYDYLLNAFLSAHQQEIAEGFSYKDPFFDY